MTELHPADDEALMVAFCLGDDAAFNVLFDRYGAAIYRALLRLTCDRNSATDLTQATFLSVVRARDRFVRGSSFRAWLYAIAMNAWRDDRRRAKREVLTGDGTLPDRGYEPALRDPWLEEKLHSALALVPDIQRQVVVLHQLEGFSFKEIGHMLFITEAAAKVRAHRGYERLRALLDPSGSGHE